MVAFNYETQKSSALPKEVVELLKEKERERKSKTEVKAKL